MNRIRITQGMVENAKAEAKDVILWDSMVSGFHLKITPTGRRVYYVYYRTAARQQRRHKLGVHPVLSTEQARRMAKVIIGKAASGEDPAEERREQRNAARRQCQGNPGGVESIPNRNA